MPSDDLKIYTCYFGRARHLKAAGLDGACVPICAMRSRWIGRDMWARNYTPLAPSAYLVKAIKGGDVDVEGYNEVYNEQLFKLDPHQVVKELALQTGKEGVVVLMCYEKPPQHCHRHLVATWLRLSGYVVTEWDGDGVEDGKQQQGSLIL